MMNRFRNKNRKRGFTFVESMVVVGIMGLVFAGMVQIFQYMNSYQNSKPATDIMMLKNTRRLFLKVFTELQEGIEVIHPIPGVTLPYLVFVDKNNDISVYYLRKSDKTDEGAGEFTLCMKTRELASEGYSTKNVEQQLIDKIERMTFTAHGGGAVLVNARLKEQKSELNLLTLVNLKNFQSSL
jgi:prepilin-type N-terminal cleavage/methylation domain-containing protein